MGKKIARLIIITTIQILSEPEQTMLFADLPSTACTDIFARVRHLSIINVARDFFKKGCAVHPFSRIEISSPH